MTYNVHHGVGGDGIFDPQRLAAVIRAADPDLIALQEVDVGTERIGGRDLAAELARATDMHVAFGRAIDLEGGAYGQAVLSKRPIASSRVHALPGRPDAERRIAFETLVTGERGDMTVRLVTTHLDHVALNSDRPAQAAALVECFGMPDGTPTLLAGDLNATPESEPYRTIDAAFVDASAAHAMPTFPAPAPQRRIDYVFVRRGEGWRVIASRVIDEPVASDHRPLVVDLARD